MFAELFKGVFLLRFRDSVPDIRVACIESFGHWIASCEYFLEDKYLKYLGWQLNDKVVLYQLLDYNCECRVVE